PGSFASLERWDVVDVDCCQQTRRSQLGGGFRYERHRRGHDPLAAKCLGSVCALEDHLARLGLWIHVSECLRERLFLIWGNQPLHVAWFVVGGCRDITG